MVLGYLLPAVVVFIIVSVATYIGALRALEVYFDPNRDSYFLSDEPARPRDR